MMSLRALLAVLCIGVLMVPGPAPAVATAPDSVPVPVPAESPQAAKTGASPDYDGDGKADLATVTYFDDRDPWVFGIMVRYGTGATQTIRPSDLGYDGEPWVVEWILSGPLLARDLNGDGYGDLAFAARESGVKPSLIVVYGSSSGLDLTSRAVTVLPVPASATTGELALIDLPKRRLAVVIDPDQQAPWLLVYDLDGAGHPTGTPAKLQLGKGKLPKVGGTPWYGSYALASYGNRLFIGWSGAKVNGKTWAGAVVAVSFSASGVSSARLVTRNSKGVPGVAAKSDSFGEDLAARDGYLVVGVLGDTIGGVRRAGSVQIFSLAKGALKPLQRISQSTPGVPGKSERGDLFGQWVELGTVCPGVTSVIVGAPNEDIPKGDYGEGSAWVIPLKKAKGCTAKQLYQGHGLGAASRTGDGIGHLLAVVRDAGRKVDDVLIGGVFGYSEGPSTSPLFRWSPTAGVVARYQDAFSELAGR